MGQDPRAGSSAMTGAAEEEQAVSGTRDPEHIQREIEETREHLGDTVEALSQKADVKAQASQKLKDARASMSERLDRAKEASPASATSAAEQVSDKARKNPLPFAAVGAFAAGFLAGRLTRR